MTERRPEHPDEEPLGPRDQQGFDELQPHPDHPLFEQMRKDRDELAARREAENGGENPPAEDPPAEDPPAEELSAEEPSAGGPPGGEPPGDEPQGEDPPGDDPPEDDPPLGLLDHLEDLRRTILDSGIAALVATILSWFFSERLLDLLIRPIKDEGVYFTAPNEAFLTQLKLSAAMGLFVVAPFIFFKIYMFVLPGLHRREAKVVTPLLISSTLLFYTGVAFSFLVVIPQIMAFLLGFGTDLLSPLIGVGSYFNFVTHLCLAFGLVFQLPLLVLALSAIGLVNPRMLLRTWRIAIVAIFAASAILTPPDIISQFMMAGPVILLYLGSVLVAMVVTRRKRKED